MFAKHVLLALLPAAVTAWDSKLCNNAGGCQGLTWFDGYGFRCPSGATLLTQPFAASISDIAQGSYQYVAADEFPSSCIRSQDVPGDAATTHLIRHAVSDSIAIYGYITDDCNQVPVLHPGDCYNYNPNPSPFTVCQVTENGFATSDFCKEDPSLHL